MLIIWAAVGATLAVLITPTVYRNLNQKPLDGLIMGLIVGVIGSLPGLLVFWLLLPYRFRQSDQPPNPLDGFRWRGMAQMHSHNILEVRDIHTFIGQFHILEGVSLEVPRGSITVILGRNGAGKTTTLRSIIGLNNPRSGSIFYNGRNITHATAHEIAASGIGYVPEHRAIFKELTVRENLEIAARKRGDLERNQQFIFDLFPDLQRLIDLPGGNLSGGQQQMLAIARALVPDNDLLLIDEPSEGLAPVIIDQLMAAIKQLAKHKTVLLVEQNFRVASRLADRYVIIDDGHSVMSGDMADLIKNPDVIKRYLGVA
ncbi:MAG: hypothetical protein Kow00117_14430 [Phototrophicales bacterium]